jgi:hypothetical protein
MKNIFLFKFWDELTQKLKVAKEQQLKLAIDRSTYNYDNEDFEIFEGLPIV